MATATYTTEKVAVATEPSAAKIFFIQSHSGDFSDELRISDLSANLAVHDFTKDMTDSFYKEAERIVKDRQHDRSAWVYEMRRATFSSMLQIHDTADGGKVVAELELSILKRYGTWKLSFPAGSTHSSCDVEITPVSIMQNKEAFVVGKDSYMWDMSMGGKKGELRKTVDGKEICVGRFAAKEWFKNSCVLVLDSDEVEDVIGLGTCVAALNRDI